MRTKLLPLLLCVASVFFFVSAQGAERTAGRILAAKVRGTVSGLNKADNSVKTLHDSDSLTEGYVITTGKKSSVVLLFANGSAVNLGEDSTLSIDEFLMDPFDAKSAVADAKEEPSTSVTKLSLERGEFVGNVKHLHRESGSTYTVNTPVGAAGIRGTTFRILLQTASNGVVTFSLGTSEGLVALIDLNGAEHSIPAGKEIKVEVENGSIRVSGIEDMSAADQAAIARAIEEVLASRGATFGTGGAPDALRPNEDTTPGDGRGPSRG